ATGRSRIDEDAMTIAKGLVTEYGSKILLPVDVVASTRFANDGEQITVDAADGVPETHLIMDIGPKTVEAFKEALEGAKTVVWNGPVGVFEFDNFATGTMEIARALGDVTAQGGTTIIGGGDSAAAIAKAGLTDKMTHVSTGGGASLEMLEGRELPGVAVLADK
ncbi:MAG TPA: phosphoglycerate kinase, partial [Aggregatilineales bacterium]|nr:phosphoglycerate kinase [Aggregatilineales bacterium]